MSLARALRPRRFYRWRVPAGYAVAALAITLARPTVRSLAIGLAIALLGQATRLWSAGHCDKALHLATGGPYAHTQHPLYLGTLLITLGITVASARPSILALAGLYFLVFYPFAIREERVFLAERFGAEHAAWAAQVPEFFPRLAPGGPRSSRFSWRRVLANREWKACLAHLVVLGLLVLRQFDLL